MSTLTGIWVNIVLYSVILVGIWVYIWLHLCILVGMWFTILNGIWVCSIHVHDVEILYIGKKYVACGHIEGEGEIPPPPLPFEDWESAEDGDRFRLEKRDGKRQAVRVEPKTKGKCFWCGREGHMARDCTWGTHVNGGPPRPAPLPKEQSKKGDQQNGTSHLENQMDSSPVEVDV